MKQRYESGAIKNSPIYAVAKAAMLNLINAEDGESQKEAFGVIGKLCHDDNMGFPAMIREVFIEDYSEYVMQESVKAFKDNKHVRDIVAGMLYDWGQLNRVIEAGK